MSIMYVCSSCFVSASSGRRCELCGGELRERRIAFDGGEYAQEEVSSPPTEEELEEPSPGVDDSGWKKQVEKTKTGLMLLVVGYMLTWVPVVSFIGGLLLLVGAINIVLGRKPFGRAHAKKTLVAAGLIAFGVIGLITVYVVFEAAMLQATTAEEFTSLMTSFLLGFFAVAAIAQIASILLAFELEKPAGKAILAGAYGSSLVVFAMFYLVIQNTMQMSMETGSFDSLGFTMQMLTLSLLWAAPSVLYAVAYYLAWHRIKEGEIPAWPSAVQDQVPLP